MRTFYEEAALRAMQGILGFTSQADWSKGEWNDPRETVEQMAELAFDIAEAMVEEWNKRANSGNVKGQARGPYAD